MRPVSRLMFVALLAAGLLVSPAFAQELKYDYVEFRYLFDVEVDDGPDDGDGFSLGGSFRFEEKFYGFGSYTVADFDGPDAELDTLEAGVGYIHALSPKWDGNASFSLIRSEVEVGIFDDDETGFALRARARSMVAERVEFRGSVNFVDVEDSDTYLRLEGDYFFSPRFAAGMSIDVGGDIDVIAGGVRYFFRR